VKAASTCQLGTGRRRAGLGIGEIGRDCLLDKGESQLDVALRVEPDLEPVRPAGTQGDPLVRLQLGPPRPDDLPGQADVQRALGIEVSHLPLADPDGGTGGEGPFAKGSALERAAPLDELRRRGQASASISSKPSCRQARKTSASGTAAGSVDTAICTSST
jgi:hypothetical protein